MAVSIKPFKMTLLQQPLKFADTTSERKSSNTALVTFYTSPRNIAIWSKRFDLQFTAILSLWLREKLTTTKNLNSGSCREDFLLSKRIEGSLTTMIGYH